MKFSFYKKELKLKHTFTISRNSRSVQEVLYVELEHDGITGVGEASPSERYGETIESTIQFFQKINLEQFDSAYVVEDIQKYLQALAPGSYAGKAAIDIALNDWIGKRLNIPLWKLWGFRKNNLPKTSITIGAGTIDEIIQKVREARDYPILKVKVGVQNDEEIISAIRTETDKIMYVDANEGWSPKERALEKISFMRQHGVELIEQPLPAKDNIGMLWLKSRSRLPIIADESCTSVHELPALKEYFDGINVKLMKCGGLKNALHLIYTAKKILGMKVMLGCMIESSVGISAAAQLSPLVDYCDLDGNILISNDPFLGVSNIEGKLFLSDLPGIGVRTAQ
ncbi:MAG: dipeptide epimerase [Ignavibacteria bacterium]|nr:dipeptide epimerase [Ignavibacteria bacterium]